jgi:hypothetical protein
MLLLRKKKYAAMKLEKVEPYSKALFQQLQQDLSKRPLSEARKYYFVAMPNVTLEGKDISIDDPVLLQNPENLSIFCFKREVKGLDMVRRDWSELCRKASTDIIDVVLRCDAGKRDEVIGTIKSKLQEIEQLMSDNLIKIDDYIITKQLTRSLEQYSDAAKLPHVTVAMKASKRGKIVRAGDVVEFLMTSSESTPQNTLSDRACGKDDYINYIKHMANEEKLSKEDPQRVVKPYLDYPIDMKIDLIYYKEQQLLTPIMRLIDVLEEASTSMIADCLGLDSAKYALRERRGNDVGNNSRDLEAEAAWASDSPFEKYRDMAPLYISCPRCQVSFPFLGLFSYVPFSRIDSFMAAPQQIREQLNYWGLPFKMHTAGYFNKMNNCQFNKSGFVCPTPNCPGLFDFGQMDGSKYSANISPSTITTYLCNVTTSIIRSYIQSFEQNQFIYNSKDLLNTIVTYNADGSVLDSSQYVSNELKIKNTQPLRKAIHQLDVINFIQYIMFLFDYTRQRVVLQRECDERLNRQIGTGNHSKSLMSIYTIGVQQNGVHFQPKFDPKGGDPSQSAKNSHQFYDLLNQITNPTGQSLDFDQFQSQFQFSNDETDIGSNFGLPKTLWTRSADERACADLDSTLSPEIIQCAMVVKNHIKETFLNHNDFATLDLAKVFGFLKL